MKERKPLRLQLKIVLVACTVLFGICTAPKTVEASVSHTVDEAMAWVKSLEGRSDIYYYYDMQCIDLIYDYYKYLGNPFVEGDGIDYAKNELPIGWKRIKNAIPQRGDILVYTNPDFGHVAIYESEYETWHSNYGGKKAVQKVTNVRYDELTDYYGVIRPDWNNLRRVTPLIMDKVTNVTGTSAKINAHLSSTIACSETGFYYGSIPTAMTKVKTSVSGNVSSLSFDLGTGKWTGALKKANLYCYQFYIIASGVEYKSDIGYFNTNGENIPNAAITEKAVNVKLDSRGVATFTPMEEGYYGLCLYDNFGLIFDFIRDRLKRSGSPCHPETLGETIVYISKSECGKPYTKNMAYCFKDISGISGDFDSGYYAIVFYYPNPPIINDISETGDHRTLEFLTHYGYESEVSDIELSNTKLPTPTGLRWDENGMAWDAVSIPAGLGEPVYYLSVYKTEKCKKVDTMRFDINIPEEEFHLVKGTSTSKYNYLVADNKYDYYIALRCASSDLTKAIPSDYTEFVKFGDDSRTRANSELDEGNTNRPGSGQGSNSGSSGGSGNSGAINKPSNYDNWDSIPDGSSFASYEGNTFYKEGQNVKCKNASGNYLINTFACDGTYTYYFQADGTAMKDRLTYHPDGVHVIYFDQYGHEVFSNFANVRKTIAGEDVDDYCFFDVFGYLYVDVVTFGNAEAGNGDKIYYANEYGVMPRGKWFQFSPNAKWAGTETVPSEFSNQYGYATDDGSLMINQATYDWEGKTCYMQGNGVALY